MDLELLKSKRQELFKEKDRYASARADIDAQEAETDHKIASLDTVIEMFNDGGGATGFADMTIPGQILSVLKEDIFGSMTAREITDAILAKGVQPSSPNFPIFVNTACARLAERKKITVSVNSEGKKTFSIA